MSSTADPATDLDTAPTAVDTVDSAYLQSMVGYNARMAALSVIGHILPGLAPYGLRIVDFSILSVIGHNPGITSRQLCDVLNLLPPNLVGKIGALEKRGLLRRLPHPQDGRALGLHLTTEGQDFMRQAEATVFEREAEATRGLSAAERRTLIRLLQKLYAC